MLRPVEGTLLPGAEGTLLPPAEGTFLPPAEGTRLPSGEGTLLPVMEGTAPAPPPPGPGYIGMEQCRTCHEESYQTWIRTPHGRWVFPSRQGKPESLIPDQKTSLPQGKSTPERSPGKADCESCHGPGSFHRETPEDKTRIVGFGKDSPSTAKEKLQCHTRGKILFWKESPHETGAVCVNCHRVMDRISSAGLLSKPSEEGLCLSCHKTLRAERRGSPHALSGIFAETPCTICHNPHGTSAEHLLTSPSVNETCYQCHGEKRGPFLFEHFPVTENCLLCHASHGSVQKNILKVRQPFLCLDCHTNLPGTHDPLNPNSRYTYNRGCINCHPMIHGSNHPSGVRFQR
ncbi:MAG: DmsE family decaheme c-type cytochrome [Nitrospirae bacterium]|nr:DmsE family decaheme c-type cytochrome [Nitrospirota bacterium]